MPLNRRFVRAEIKEVGPIWLITLTLSYYSAYEFTESYVCDTLDNAYKKLLLLRCGKDGIRVLDKTNKDILLQ